MKSGNQIFEEFQKNMQELIAKSPAADIEKNVKAFMSQGFSKLDLVTREEFDIQVAMVDKLRERIDVLEGLVKALEEKNNNRVFND
ncbi:MAG: accessory factor UbiK family protein [Alcaligenaceae bacterium]|nr:accessory factor UbiK family protein [Alcaligenaceae bacterium]